MRAPYQVLIFPYIKTDESIQYGIFNRSDYGYWQGIAGGGEDGETPIESAKREAFEEVRYYKRMSIYKTRFCVFTTSRGCSW